MATKVLDSWALIAFFEDEPAADEVEKVLGIHCTPITWPVT